LAALAGLVLAALLLLSRLVLAALLLAGLILAALLRVALAVLVALRVVLLVRHRTHSVILRGLSLQTPAHQETAGAGEGSSSGCVICEQRLEIMAKIVRIDAASRRRRGKNRIYSGL
jgi:hypothetical protein